MEIEIEIQGCVAVPPDVDINYFTDEFIKWVESKGWSFGGGFSEIVDGYYIKSDGSKGKSVLDE